MVKIMESSIKMDDLGGFPYFWKHPYTSILKKLIPNLLQHGGRGMDMTRNAQKAGLKAEVQQKGAV